MTNAKKNWVKIINRFKKIESLEFFLEKNLLTMDNPQEVMLLKELALKKIEELAREHDV